MKNLLVSFIGLVLLALAYLCTYWYDLIEGNEAREFFVFMIGFVLSIGGIYLTAYGIYKKLEKHDNELP